MAKFVIIANGDATELKAAMSLINADDTLVCIDGGTLHAISLGLNPDIVIGDLDSLPSQTADELAHKGIKIIKKPRRKNETDLELALDYAVNSGAREILILAAMGGRMDQTLANVLLLSRPAWASARIMVADGNQRAWLLRGPDELKLSGRAGDTFSLVPLSEEIKGVTLEGFEWNLKDANFSLGSTQPVSNSLTGDSATVKISSGIALAVHIPIMQD